MANKDGQLQYGVGVFPDRRWSVQENLQKQKARPANVRAHYVFDPQNFPNAKFKKTEFWGGSGLPGKFPSTPYGTFHVEKIVAGSTIQNLQKRLGVKDYQHAYNVPTPGIDPKVGHVRHDIMIHGARYKEQLHNLVTHGCAGLRPQDRPALDAAYEQAKKASPDGNLALVVSPGEKGVSEYRFIPAHQAKNLKTADQAVEQEKKGKEDKEKQQEKEKPPHDVSAKPVSAGTDDTRPRKIKHTAIQRKMKRQIHKQNKQRHAHTQHVHKQKTQLRHHTTHSHKKSYATSHNPGTNPRHTSKPNPATYRTFEYHKAKPHDPTTNPAQQG